ncbi:MAG: TIR domain-containing protein [Bacilli bacterium]|nr:TIR domain-containing protein [Bacilli bacterium]
MSHRVFISFKKEDLSYKNKIVAKLEEKGIQVNHLDEEIRSEDIDYVMQQIRDKWQGSTTVTIFLIGTHSSENEGLDYYGRNHQSFIIRELRSALSDREGNPRDGILGVILPEMEQKVFGGSYICKHCQQTISIVRIDDSTVIREFSKNYYLRSDDCGHFEEDGRFCVLCRYNEFMQDPEKFINQAYEKLGKPIAKYVTYKGIKHEGDY